MYLKYLSIHFKSIMQYKASFLMTAIGQFLTSFTTFIEVYFLFNRFHTVNGFTFSEVLLCYTSILASFSIAECFVRGFDAFSGMISNGEFDRVMVRPRNEIIQILGSKIEFTRIGRLLQAVIIMCYAIPTCGIAWTPDKIITYILMIVCGTLLFSGLFVVYASFCFFTTEGLEFMNIFTDGAREFGTYPYSIYGKGILKILTFFIPLALVQYYPFLYLIGRSANRFLMLLPILSLVFLFPCMIFWKIGLHHYKSTGS